LYSDKSVRAHTRTTLIADTQRVRLLSVVKALLYNKTLWGPFKKYSNNGAWGKMPPTPIWTALSGKVHIINSSTGLCKFCYDVDVTDLQYRSILVTLECKWKITMVKILRRNVDFLTSVWKMIRLQNTSFCIWNV
jgi:hypothetical protein